jgi:hypothetical protein
MLDVSRVVRNPRLTTSITLKRPTLTLAKEGEMSRTYADSTIRAIVHPAKLSDLMMLPEGERISNAIVVYSTSEIREGNGKDTSADVIVYQSQNWRVAKLDHYELYGYYKAICNNFVKGGA